MLRTNILGDARFFVICSTLAFACGFFVDQFRDDPLRLLYQTKEERIMSIVARENREGMAEAVINLKLPEYISVERLRTFIQNEEGIVLDARPEVFHRRGHIKGALSLPRADFETRYHELKGTLETDKGRKIIVYCSSMSCKDADLVRGALVALGYSNVSILKGGWASWKGEEYVSIEEGL